MQLTVIGVFTILAAILAFRGPPSHLLGLVLFLMIFGAASAIQLPALGGASAPPAQVALGFLLAKLVSDRHLQKDVLTAARVNAPIVFFLAYAVISAFVLPRLFAGAMYVVGQRPLIVGSVVVPEPLGPSAANLTQLFYIASTATVMLAAHVIARREDVAERISRIMIALGFLHIGFGLVDQAAYYLHAGDLLAPLRNASYAQVAPQLFSSGVKRISGSFPEPSSYATFGFPIAVFLTEWWMRRSRARWAGVAAVGVIAMILLSTASTGYVSLAGYGLCLLVRGLRGPSRGYRLAKAMIIVVFCLFGAFMALVFVAIQPEQAAMWADLVNSLTLGKLGSSSATERLGWARQGWDAFLLSRGIGVGVGSFRSSSLFMALIGSVGLPGCIAFLMQIVRIAWPRRLRSVAGADDADTLAAAAQWTALLSLLPLAASGATPDPGLIFGIFGGLASAAPVRRLLSRERAILDGSPSGRTPYSPHPPLSPPAAG